MAKIIALDLDGTLIESSMFEIDRDTLRALITLQEHGIKVVLASGRPISMMTPAAKLLSLENNGGVLIGSNGYEIYDYSDDTKVSSEMVLPHELVDSVYEFSQHHFAYLSLETEAGIFVYGNPLIRRLRTVYFKIKMRRNAHGVVDRYKQAKSKEELKHPVVKIGVAAVHKRSLLALKNHIVSHHGDVSEATLVTDHYLDIMPTGVHKGNALKSICDKYDISMSDVIAFGDGENDITMLKMSGTGVAMGNAMPLVKASADVVTDKNTQKGIYHYLKEVFSHIVD